VFVHAKREVLLAKQMLSLLELACSFVRPMFVLNKQQVTLLHQACSFVRSMFVLNNYQVTLLHECQFPIEQILHLKMVIHHIKLTSLRLFVMSAQELCKRVMVNAFPGLLKTDL
jgi:hypothetical protein